MADPITLSQASRAAEDAEYIKLFVESTNYENATPDGVAKRSISGINSDVDTLISNTTLVVDSAQQVIDFVNQVGDDLDYLYNYLGGYTSNPIERPNGDALEVGDYYFNTTGNYLSYYSTSDTSWTTIDPESIAQNAVDSQTARDEALTASTEATSANSSALSAQTVSETARDEAVAAKDLSEEARDETVAAKDIAVAARDEAVTAGDLASSAKTASESARDESVQASAEATGAKDLAVTAQSETEALFNGFDSSVADAISTTNTDVAFEATFNDSLNISKGYGTHDTITVASETVDLPSKSVDFACASERTVINKSGVLETASAHDPAIGSGGLWCHKAYSNEFKYSEDFSNAEWDKEGGTAITTSSSLWLDGVTYAQDLTVNADSAFRSIRRTSTPTAIGETWVYSVFAKAGTTDIFRIRVASNGEAEFDLTNGTATAISSEKAGIINVSGGWYLCYSVVEFTTAGSQVKIVDMTSTAAVTGDFITVFGAMAVNANSILPYIKTESSSVSVAKTTLSVPLMGNMPSAGMPFAIEVDCAIPDTVDESVVFRQARNTLTDLFLRRQSSGLIQFGMASEGATKTADYNGDTGVHKYVCKYDGGGNFYLFEDGLQVASNTTSTPSYDLNIDLNIGNDSLYSLNGQLKNFRIHHGLVSDDTIKSWGAAV